jgi:hypothetical protein
VISTATMQHPELDWWSSIAKVWRGRITLSKAPTGTRSDYSRINVSFHSLRV